MAFYKPLQEEAYDHLRERILSGSLVPGVLYSETKMAAEIGISRTPMKDALVRLAQDKYIDIIPSKGFRLHVMSSEDIWSTYQARTAIEGFCAVVLAAAKNTPEGQRDIALMQEMITRMETVLESGGPSEEYLACDMKFHETLVHHCGNEEFIRLFSSYQHRLQTIAEESLHTPGRYREALREHQQIVDAIREAASPEDLRAYLAVKAHMEASRDLTLRNRMAE